MTIKVIAYARYGELLGFTESELPLPDPPILRELLKHSSFAKLPPDVLLAVNQGFVTKDEMLYSGDEVAVMPPVSGG